MEETFAEFLKLNESKNIMAVAGTPLTLAGLWVMLYPASCLTRYKYRHKYRHKYRCKYRYKYTYKYRHKYRYRYQYR